MGYRFTDFARLGLPLQLVAGAASVSIITSMLHLWYLWAIGAAGAIAVFVVAMRVRPMGWYAPGRFREDEVEMLSGSPKTPGTSTAWSRVHVDDP